MSFIFKDENLLNSLLKVAQESKDVPITHQIISGYEAASKLLYKLQSDLGDETAPKTSAPISSESPLRGSDSELKVADLRTLGDFINWLADKKITWDGKRIAWTPAEREAAPNDPEISKAWAFSSYDFDRSKREIDRKPTTKDAYANKDNLTNYLTYLRDTQEARENNVFKFMIGALIGELNGFLRIKGQKPIDTKSPPTTPGSLIDTKLIIDVVPDVLDPDNPLDGLNEHPFKANKKENNWLQYSDIATQPAFLSWLRNRKVKIKTGNFTSTAGALDADGDPCAAIHILYKRAVQLNNVAGGGTDDALVPNYSKAVAEYLKNIQAYGSKINGLDGTPCVVTKPGTVGQAAAGVQGVGAAGVQGAGVGGAGGAGGAGEDRRTIQLISEVVSKYPLDVSVVSFDDISTFCKAIEKFNYTPWSQTTSQIGDYIRQAKASLSGSKPTTLRDGISLNTQWARDPKGNYVNPFASSFDEPGKFCHYIKFVETIVDNTASLITSFMTKYKKELGPSEYSISVSQVGTGTSSGNSIYYYNKSAIGNYQSMASCFI